MIRWVGSDRLGCIGAIVSKGLSRGRKMLPPKVSPAKQQNQESFSGMSAAEG